MHTPEALHGAMFPIVRQIVQLLAGYIFAKGALNEEMTTAITGLVLSAGTVVWMMVARAKTIQAAQEAQAVQDAQRAPKP